ncbi:hypothetical protein F4780DRAFT_562111 [Xylariomycetidae sp. FL0641]|nr:hypothetical protein F4780DRAFT_562111 [Xylariomycetidae sp. FL0641]
MPRPKRARAARAQGNVSNAAGFTGQKLENSESLLLPNAQPAAQSNHLWPPPMFQAYCLTHFVMECWIYHQEENRKCNTIIEQFRKLVPKPKSIKKPATAPTRVQPSRRAREKHAVPPKEEAEVPQEPLIEVGSEAALEAQKLIDAVNFVRNRLGLDAPWEEYKDRLEALKGEVVELMQEKGYGGQANEEHRNCAFSKALPLECRYCGYGQRMVTSSGIGESHPAPPAPMHLIEPEDILPEQMCELAGVAFAVDICGKEEKIILLHMDGLKEVMEDQAEEQGISPEDLYWKMGGYVDGADRPAKRVKTEGSVSSASSEASE